jgi:hypothetical protein
VNLLDWLADHDRSLTDCTQADLDTWAAAGHSYRDETAHFVRWAVSHRHASGWHRCRCAGVRTRRG